MKCYRKGHKKSNGNLSRLLIQRTNHTFIALNQYFARYPNLPPTQYEQYLLLVLACLHITSTTISHPIKSPIQFKF